MSAPTRLLALGESFVEWAQYPTVKAVDKLSGWKFYYHAHPPFERLAQEHGHFHVFTPALRNMPQEGAAYSHLIGLSVDQQGLPLRLFTTNRWVTGESWQSAEALVEFIKKPGLSRTEPADVAQWLGLIIALYEVEICALLRARDKRLEQRTAMIKVDPYEDRRLRIPSQHPVNLLHRISRDSAAKTFK